MTPSSTPVADVLLLFAFSLSGAPGAAGQGQAVVASNALLPAVAGAISAQFAAVLGLPPSAIRIVNVTDVATGQVTRASRRRRALAGAPGSQGVSVTVAANLGKVPTQAGVAAMTAALGGANFTAALRQVVSTLASALGRPAAAFAAAPGAPPSLANAPFALPAPPLAAAAPSSAAPDNSGAVGGGVGGGIVALACALWSWRSYRKHKALPCCRDRKAERAKEAEQRRLAAEAQDMKEALSVVSPLAAGGAGSGGAGAGGGVAGAGGGSGEGGALVIRNLSMRNAAAAEEVARLAAEAAKRDEENARLRAMLAQQAESIAKASGAALATTAAPPPRADKAKFGPTSSL